MVQFHPSPLRPLRHADGNLASDGRWSYTWDAENRLVQMLMADGFATLGMDVLKIEFDYDYLGRRVQKRVLRKAIQNPSGPVIGVQDTGSGGTTALSPDGGIIPPPPPPSQWQLISSRQYVWDGWLCIAEIVEREDLRRSHTWGIDLSGGYGGAGGVGGLVFLVNANDIPQQVYQCFYDGNGNLTSLRDDSQAIAAQYDYGPFGELLTARGDYAAENPYRFSTKYVDAETGLYYYGYRYYNSSTGRWLSRDPIGEEGGLNLYAFVKNGPANSSDSLGLERVSFIFGAFINGRLGKWLKEPLPFGWWYKTDQRGFGGGSFRLFSVISFDTIDLGQDEMMTYGWGFIRSSPSTRAKRDSNGKVRIQRKTATPRGNVNISNTGPCETTFTVTAAGLYPFAPAQNNPTSWQNFAIDFHYTLRVWADNCDTVQMEFTVTHDAFPDYEAIVNSQWVIYRYETTAAGPGMSSNSLGPGGDIQGRSRFSLEADTPSCCGED